MCFGPSTLGAGAKTRLGSGIKKLTPHCICRPGSPMMAHAAALAVEFTKRTPPAAPAPAGKDQELFDLVRTGIERSMPLTELTREVRSLLEAGATIGGSHVLHLAAAHQNLHALVLLVEARLEIAVMLQEGKTLLFADFNRLDQHGVTPLMVAAATAPGNVNCFEPAPPLECCSALIRFGADKNAVDRNVRTQSRAAAGPCTLPPPLPPSSCGHTPRASYPLCVCVCVCVCVCMIGCYCALPDNLTSRAVHTCACLWCARDHRVSRRLDTCGRPAAASSTALWLLACRWTATAAR